MKSYVLKILQTVVLVTVCLISGMMINDSELFTASANVGDVKTVIIDPGHGGFDGGAVAADGTIEKDINLEISLNLSQMLKSAGYNVILTRETDASTEDDETEKIALRKKSDLKNRLDLMKNNPDAVFVSIHLNKFTTSAARGSQVFYNGKIEKSKILGDSIQNSIKAMLQPENTRVNKQATSSTYLLYNATIPAVLVECGFLSNKVELEMLKKEEYQKKIAFCCMCGINDYFNNKGVINNVGEA